MTPLAWLLLAYGALTTFWLVIALGTVDEQRAELHKLRRRLHPSTRKALR